MKRTIKFRTWNGRSIYEPNDIAYILQLDGRVLDIEIFGSSQSVLAYKREPNNDIILMQFTGLHDKNGKEIYEGDIIKLGEIICPITFNDGAFQMVMNEQQGRSDANQDRVKNFEVIGNIYENPELIK